MSGYVQKQQPQGGEYLCSVPWLPPLLSCMIPHHVYNHLLKTHHVTNPSIQYQVLKQIVIRYDVQGRL